MEINQPSETPTIRSRQYRDMTQLEIKKYNPLTYGACIESMTKKYYFEMSGYEMVSTFASDFAIAEWYGADSVNDTFNRTTKEWLSNVKYFAEIVMTLNAFCWRWYEWEGEESELGKLFSDLYYRANELAYDTYEGEDARMYFELTD